MHIPAIGYAAPAGVVQHNLVRGLQRHGVCRQGSCSIATGHFMTTERRLGVQMKHSCAFQAGATGCTCYWMHVPLDACQDLELL